MIYNVARAATLEVSIVCFIIFNFSITAMFYETVFVHDRSSLGGASALAEPTAKPTQLLPQLEAFFGLHLLLLNEVLNLLLLEPSLSICINYKAIIIDVNILHCIYV
jgi:hypothetical protein